MRRDVCGILRTGRRGSLRCRWAAIGSSVFRAAVRLLARTRLSGPSRVRIGKLTLGERAAPWRSFARWTSGRSVAFCLGRSPLSSPLLCAAELWVGTNGRDESGMRTIVRLWPTLRRIQLCPERRVCVIEKRGQIQFAPHSPRAERALRANWTCPLFPTIDWQT